MGIYVFNKGKAQAIYGSKAIQPDCYEVFSDDTVEQLRLAGFSLVFEGDADFHPLFVTNIPDRTPNQLLTTR
jgi:hypothetical protein